MDTFEQHFDYYSKNIGRQTTKEEHEAAFFAWESALKLNKESGANVPLDRLVIKQTFKEEKERFLKEVQRLCNTGNRDAGAKLEERLQGIRAIESKLIEKGIAL